MAALEQEPRIGGKSQVVGRIVKTGTLCCVVLATPFLFVGGPGPTSSPGYQAAWNIGHIVFFGLLTFLLHQKVAWLKAGSNWKKFVAYSLFVLSLGLAIEWAQYGLNRTPDWHDIWRNQLGAWVAWSLVCRRSPVLRMIIIALGVFLTFELYLVSDAIWTDWNIQNQTPLIFQLEEERDLNRWTGNVFFSETTGTRGRASLKVPFTTDLYSGAKLNQFPHDWEGFQWLAFEVLNPAEEAISLTIRINDRIHDQEGHRYSDRFNKKLLVDPGWNHFEISLVEVEQAPSSREMDLKNVFGLGLFTTNLKEPRVLFFDYFRLQ